MLIKNLKKYCVICYFNSYDHKDGVDSNGHDFAFEERRQYNYAYFNLSILEVKNVLDDLLSDSNLDLTTIDVKEQDEDLEDCPFL